MKEINRRDFLGGIGAAAFAAAWAYSRVAVVAQQRTRTGGGRPLPAFDLPHLRVSSLEGTHAYPDVAVAPGGVVWIAYVSTHMAGDFIAARSFDGKELSGHLKVSEQTGVECQPAVCPAGKDDAWIAWSARRGGKWLVLARRVGSGRMSREHVVGEGGQCNWTPAVAPAGDGGVWVAWQRLDGKRKGIFARRFESDTWRDELLLSGDESQCHRPAAALSADGTVIFAWDCYRGARYTALWRAWKDGSLSAVRTLADDGAFINADCSLAPDERGRVWFTCCRDRGYALGAIDGERVLTPAGSASAAPALAMDGRGRPWTCAQRLHVVCRDSDGPYSPLRAQPQGPWNIQGEKSRICVLGDKVWVIWEDMAGEIWMRPYAIGGSLGGAPVLKAKAARKAKRSIPSRPKPSSLKYDGKRYGVYFGDLHLHVTASEGWGYYDWMYNRQRDRDGLDFMATTDHDACTPDFLSPSEWAIIQENSRRFCVPGIFSTFPGWEVSGPGQRGRYGDRNVICIDDEQEHINCTEARANRPDRLYATLDPTKYLIQAGHHVSRKFAPTDWEFLPGKATPFVEITSVHGVFEYTGNAGAPRDEQTGHCVQDGLARGHRIGIMSSSDDHHAATGRSNDCIAAIATANTREALWEAFRARRVYATRRERYFIDFRVDSHIMGEEFFVREPGKRHVTATVRSASEKPVGTVEVVRNNKVVHKVETDRDSANVDFTDDGRTGTVTTYYYLRVTGIPGRAMAWSSPVWATVLDVRPAVGRLLIPAGETRSVRVEVASPLEAKQAVLRAQVSKKGWSVRPEKTALTGEPGKPAAVVLEVTAPKGTDKEKAELTFTLETDGRKLDALRRVALHLDHWPEEGFRSAAPAAVSDRAKVAPNHIRSAGRVDKPQTKHFIRNWALLGPFPFDRRECKSIECRESVNFSPRGVNEAALAPAIGLDIADRRWVSYRPFNSEGKEGGRGEYIQLDSGGMSIDIVEHAYAYLAAHVFAPAAGKYRLLFGTDDYARVWLNGKLVYTYNDERRGATIDGDDAGQVQLAAGANILLVKLVNVNSGWGMYARLVTPDGKAVTFADAP